MVVKLWMVKGDNKGHKYEKKIVEILQKRSLMPSEISGAGSGPGVDAMFIHKGKQYYIDVYHLFFPKRYFNWSSF